MRCQGDKIRLRPLRASDRERVQAWQNDPMVRDNGLGHRFPVTEQMVDKWLGNILNPPDNNRALFGIVDLKDDELVGFVQLYQIDWIGRTACFGIAIGQKDRWGTGIASEAMEMALEFGFDGINLRKVYLEVPSFNARARRFYERAGFVVEGVRREHVFLDSQYHDLVMMAMFDETFHERRTPA